MIRNRTLLRRDGKSPCRIWAWGLITNPQALWWAQKLAQTEWRNKNVIERINYTSRPTRSVLRGSQQ